MNKRERLEEIERQATDLLIRAKGASMYPANELVILARLIIYLSKELGGEMGE